MSKNGTCMTEGCDFTVVNGTHCKRHLSFPANLRFDLTSPWVGIPDEATALLSLVWDHREVTDPCGDHYVTACTCGANRNLASKADHMFDWHRHFGELWNAALDDMGL
jgi:hypothetical protein